MWSSLGVTAMAFLTGALAFWVPTFLSRAQVSQGILPPCTKEPCNPRDRCSVTFDLHHSPATSCPSKYLEIFYIDCCLCSLYSLIFGGVTVAAGILGVCLGTGLSRWFRDKVSYADPLICAVGMLGSTPCLFVVIFVASSSIPATYVRDKHLSLQVASI